MNGFERERYSDQDCVEAFRELFPQGFAGADVIAEIAPEGWDRSPLVAIFHPSLEQVFASSKYDPLGLDLVVVDKRKQYAIAAHCVELVKPLPEGHLYLAAFLQWRSNQ